MPKTRSWTAKIERDGEDAYIILPDEALEELGWKMGDDLEITVVADGSIIVSRVAPADAPALS